jgi:hypothetical protein
MSIHREETYTVTKVKTLVDLNQDMTNFNLDFKVKASSPEDVFEVLVIDQHTLDTTEDIPFKRVQGELTGEVRNDTNTLHTYFIILKADTPTNVVITITGEQLPDYIASSQTLHSSHPSHPSSGGNIDYKIITLGIALALLIYWYLQMHKKGQTSSLRHSLLSRLKNVNLT